MGFVQIHRQKFYSALIHFVYYLTYGINALFGSRPLVLALFKPLHLDFELFITLCHDCGVEQIRTNGIVRNIELGRIVYLEIRNSEAHHYICRGVRLWEHILYLFT